MKRHATMRWAIMIASLVIICALAFWRVDMQAPIQTNILNLLPEQHSNAALDAAVARNRNAFSQQMLVLVRGSKDAPTRQAAMAAYAGFKQAGMRVNASSGQVAAALSLFQAHHFALLTPAQIKRFNTEGAKALARDVAVSLASPAGFVRFGQDPGGYVSAYMSQLPRPYPDFMPDGPLMHASRGGDDIYLLRLTLPQSGLGQGGSSLAAHAVAAAKAAVADKCTSCQLRATGAALFADAARKQGQQETIWLGLTSTLALMLLIAFVYRSLAPHVLGFLQLFSSVAVAGATVIIIFGSINILTLVFGTTLLGIAIDYAFLYFSEYWFGRSSPQQVMAKIRSGLGVGLLTGVVAFAFLLWAHFPALTQIAIFSIAGLIEAAAVVALVFPVTLVKQPVVAAHPAVDWPARFVTAACKPSWWRYIVPIVLLALSVPGWLWLQTSDDVRNLSHYPPQLMHNDQQVRQTLGRFPASGYFLVTGDNINIALAHEKALFKVIDTPDVAAMGLSRFVPPLAQQKRSLAAWQKVLKDSTTLRHAFSAMGLPAAMAGRIEKQWQASYTPLTAQALIKAVPDLGRFVIRTNTTTALLATVFGREAVDSHVLAQAAAGVDGVRYVQPLERINQTFSRIRVRATWLVVIGYFLIAGLLVWRYRIREALRMLAPPLYAMGITLGAMGWLGVSVNVFVVVALILILGLGRDYTIFLREIGAHERSPALAVVLSALATMLSFGLLALSAIPALHAFGLATLIGIAASVLLSPLSLRPRRGVSS